MSLLIYNKLQFYILYCHSVNTILKTILYSLIYWSILFTFIVLKKNIFFKYKRFTHPLQFLYNISLNNYHLPFRRPILSRARSSLPWLMNGFIRCRWFVAGGWRLAFQDIPGKLVVNILKLMDGLDVWQLQVLVNVKRDGSVLLRVKVKVNAGSVLLEVSHRFVVGDSSEV